MDGGLIVQQISPGVYKNIVYLFESKSRLLLKLLMYLIKEFKVHFDTHSSLEHVTPLHSGIRFQQIWIIMNYAFI